MLTLQEKLSIRSIAHFALVLEEQYSLAKIHLLHEEELIAQVSRAPLRPTALQGHCPSGAEASEGQREPTAAGATRAGSSARPPATPSTSARVFTHIPGEVALGEHPALSGAPTRKAVPGGWHCLDHVEQSWVTSFVPPVTSAHPQRLFEPCNSFGTAVHDLAVHSSLGGQSIHPGRGHLG